MQCDDNQLMVLLTMFPVLPVRKAEQKSRTYLAENHIDLYSAFLLGLPHGEDWEHGQKHHQLVIGRDVYAQARG
jgi:hypothetical protein